MILYLVLSLMCGLVASQTKVPKGCCGVNLMDSSNRVVIEGTPLGMKNVDFIAMQLHLCSPTPTYIQIWRRPNDKDPMQWQLLWQYRVEATVEEMNVAKYKVINLDNRVRINSITEQDREFYLGLFSPRYDKHAPPYEFYPFDKQRRAFVSLYSYESPLSISNILSTDELEFPRSFMDSVVFCVNAGCPGNPSFDDIGDTKIIQGPKGPPGPPGPPGNVIDGVFPPACDIGDWSSSMNNEIGSIKQQNDDLKQQIQKMSEQILALTNSNVPTGYCSNGLTPGSFGVNSCFFFSIDANEKKSYAEAILFCRDNFKAKLVDLDNTNKEVYLKRKISELMRSSTPSSQGVDMWTSGMFNRKVQGFVWYDEINKAKIPINTNVFQTPPILSQMTTDHCVDFMVDFASDTSYLNAALCAEKKYFICEMPKQCF